MLKIFMSLLILSTSFSTASIVFNTQDIKLENKDTNSESLQYVNQDIIIDNTKNMTQKQQPLSGSEDLQLTGPTADTRYRILMNSNGNKVLPVIEGEKVNDYLVGKGKNKTWYNHLIPGLSINVTNYAANKTEFLEKYKAVTFSYFYMVNFWNSWYDWTYEYGKSGPLLTETVTYQLSSDNYEKNIFVKNDPSHSYNESAKLVVKQEWNGNILKYTFLLSVWYHWGWGSQVDHAATASFKGDAYTFTSVPTNENNRPVEIEKIKVYSSFKLNSYSETISTNNLDDEVKNKSREPNIKNAWFKTSAILVQGYYGSIQVDKTIYIYSLIIRWNPQSGLATQDTTLLLNGVDLTRIISTSYTNGTYKFDYENSFGEQQETISSSIDPKLLGIELKGDFHLPIIYS